ncbi:MAG: sigma-54 dependent transcriptional regulator [Planctomycetota bacterium]
MSDPQRMRILVVDDEPDMAESCAFLLERQGYATVVATSAEAAMEEMLRTRFALVVTDVRMPRMSGLQLLTAVKSCDPDIEVVLITGYPDIQSAVSAIKQGAFDYLTKPYAEKDLLERVAKAVAHRRVKDGNEDLKQRLRSGPEGRRLVYRSSSFQELVQLLERAARTDASVLIEGESGTGKELLAHHLHDRSQRSDKPFVPVDCTTIPAELFESELFGHEKGAFSGAIAEKMGLFQVADGGTLFLDELGELPVPFQSKLLRAIQERTIRRVGAHTEIAVDVRIVAATNRSLQREVAEGRFREDLYYRLDVVRLVVPPLRERPEDVEELARHFLLRLGSAAGIHQIEPEAMALLRTYQWPGNVRQLGNVIERACALAQGPVLRSADLPSEITTGTAARAVAEADGGGTFQEMKARTIAALEQSYLEGLMKKHKGNVTHSADEAGMTRSALQKLLQKYGIKSSDFRD